MKVKNILFILVSIAVLSVTPFLIKTDVHWLNYYLLLMLISFACVLINMLRKANSVSNNLLRVDFIFIVISFFVPFLVGYLFLHANSIWLDEFTEYSVAFTTGDLFTHSAQTQQPPLGLLFRKLGLIFFGVNEFGLRGTSTFFFGLFGAVNYLWMKDFTKSASYSLLGSIFISLNVWLVTYSTEARPYTISMFFCALFIYFLYDHFQRAAKSKKINAALTITSVLWLLSISMQPLLFVALILVSCVFVTLINKNERALSAVKSLTLSLIIYSPILYLVITYSTDYVRNGFLNAPQLIKLLFTEDLWLLRTLFMPNKLYSVMALIMTITYFSTFFFTPNNNKKKHILFGIIIVIYLLITIILFHLKINWLLQPRYLLTALILCYYLFLFSLHSLAVNHKVKVIILSALIGVSVFSIYSDGVRKPISTAWRELYELIDQKGKPGSQGFIFSFEKPGVWCDEIFLAQEFYPTKRVSLTTYDKFAFPLMMTNDDIFTRLDQSRPLESVFFIIARHSLKEEYFNALKFSNFETFKISDFYVLKIEQNDLYTAIKSFYVQLEKLMATDDNRLRIYDGLFLVSLHEKNCVAAKKYLNKFVDLINSDKERLKNYFPRLESHEKNIARFCSK